MHFAPIIRDEETNPLNSGARVNNIQIDGISFIEHISFKAFNEGVRLKDCIHLQQQLGRVEVERLQRIQSMPIMPTGNFVQNII